ncbi:hypothetical protein ACQCT3_02240 [Sutcliffiella horikoshii]|uniref:hypothetical protein n=1 Tax=Sutcliffiella horikoshii TaxID=79883 RepID=UPI003CF29B61
MLLNKFLLVGGSLGALLVIMYLNSKKSVPVKAPISLDELTEKYSSGCDKMITEALEVNKDLTYISGYFMITLDEDAKKVMIRAQLFFQTKAGEWVEKTSTDTLPVARLKTEDLQEIRKSGEIKYEVEAPESEKVLSHS